MKTFWLPILSTFLFVLFGCDNCEECESVVSAPRTSFIFIDGEALQNLEDSLTVISDSLNTLNTEIDTLNEQINTFVDSLGVINSLLDSGRVELRDDSLALQEIIDVQTLVLDSLQQTADSLSSISSTVTANANEVASGLILLDTAQNLSNGNCLTFSDSAAVYSLPLETGSPETSYSFSITGNRYRVDLSYVTAQTLSIERELRVIAQELTVLDHTFDSLTVFCTTTECISNETSLVCYF